MTSRDRKPMVSVVMITYAHEKFIREAVEGVLMQNANFPIELIIAEDCSPDNTEAIVQDIQKNHSNGNWVSYTQHEENKGMMPNFTWALKKAKGKYIALCEGDDYWTDPLKLQKQVDFLEANLNCSAYMHRLKMINNNDSFVHKNFTCNLVKESDFFGVLDVLSNKIHGTASIMFRSKINYSLIASLTEAKVMIGDCILFLEAALNGQIFFDTSVMGVYRRHEFGMTATDELKGFNFLKEYNKFLSFADKKTNYAYYKEINEIKIDKSYSLNKLEKRLPFKLRLRVFYYHRCISLFIRFGIKMNKKLKL